MVTVSLWRSQRHKNDANIVKLWTFYNSLRLTFKLVICILYFSSLLLLAPKSGALTRKSLTSSPNIGTSKIFYFYPPRMHICWQARPKGVRWVRPQPLLEVKNFFFFFFLLLASLLFIEVGDVRKYPYPVSPLISFFRSYDFRGWRRTGKKKKNTEYGPGAKSTPPYSKSFLRAWMITPPETYGLTALSILGEILLGLATFFTK